MLDIVGAGATATSTMDWAAVWKESQGAARLLEEIGEMRKRKKNSADSETTQQQLRYEFAMPWRYQLGQLLKREAEQHWRTPDALIAKFALNTFGGLIVGFTFFRSNNSIQGTQNKLFVRPHGL